MSQTHPSSSPLERQEGGDHYKIMKIEPVEYIMSNNLDYCSGNIVKYATRWKHKDGLEALKKIVHYAQLAAWFEYREEI